MRTYDDVFKTVYEYKNKYITERGKSPSCIFLSKESIKVLEHNFGVEKIDTFLGMEVFSHTYDKYSIIQDKSFFDKIKELFNKNLS